MNLLSASLLLALGALTDADSHFPGATAVFQCKFELTHDEEILGWPPGWTRRHGPGFPRYIRMRMDENHPPVGGRSLRIDLDGGAATAYSPDVPVNPDVHYVLEGYLTTSGLRNDVAYLSLIFLDAKRTKIGSISSQPISVAPDWQRLRVGPVSPPSGASFMLVGLSLEPHGETQDLRGSASFGSLWLGQLPRVLLTARPTGQAQTSHERTARMRADEKRLPQANTDDSHFLIFSHDQNIETTGLISGFRSPSFEVRLELLDGDGQGLADHRQAFQKQSAATPVRVTWRLPANLRGFYRVRAVVAPTESSKESSTVEARSATQTVQAELSFVAVAPGILPSESEFGWSLDTNDRVVGLGSLGDVLCQSGIRWVKFPFATKESVAATAADAAKKASQTPANPTVTATANSQGNSKATTVDRSLEAKPKPNVPREETLDALISFSDRLGIEGIRLIGVLQPPAMAGETGKASFELLAAEAFARDPKTWYPSIEPILAHLATEIRYWQLGDDRDSGWSGCRDLATIVTQTKSALDKIGQDIDAGIAWEFSAPLPTVPAVRPDRADNAARTTVAAGRTQRQTAPWSFLSLPCDESIDASTIAELLEGKRSAGIARWIVLDTLPRDGHPPRERIAHLVNRMLAAKLSGAEAIFVSHPLDSQHGLLDHSGLPSELFLPWRTMALMLGGAPFAGDIDLPGGGQLHCFGSRGKYVGVLASRRPAQETLFLGSALRTQDLWGNQESRPPTIGNDGSATADFAAPQSVIDARELPTFLLGLDGPITEWQLGVSFSPNRLPSVPSNLVPVALQLKNTFPQSIGVRMNIHGLRNWYIEPRTADFRLDPGASWKQRLEVALPNDVVGGRQMVRLDFEVQADRLYRFSMYRHLEVTLGDVAFEGQTVLNDHGELEVHQTLVNRGKKPANFRCDLLAPDRRRQSSEVLVQPTGKSELTYRMPAGEELLGKAIWLRAEEINGPRVLNYRIEAPASADKPAQRPPSRKEPSLVL
jgi:hypothetical protein